MTPPICKLCGKDFYYAAQYGQGDLILFSDYKALAFGRAGKPKGCDWYCIEHYEAALLKAHLTSEAAYLQLKQEFSDIVICDSRKRLDPELWIINIGVNKAKVILYIRMITDLTPVEIKKKLLDSEFKVVHGMPTQISPYKEKLESLGAKVEIRFP